MAGTMMVGGVRRIMWDEPTEAIPAFLTVVLMPLTVSIAEGIAFGFMAYAMLKLVTGQAREAHWIVYLCAVLFLIRYVVLV